MKTIKIIGMLVMAALIGVNFTSCSNNNAKTQVVEKKLVKLTTEHMGKNINVSLSKTFSYDTDGRLNEATISTVLQSNDTVTRTYKYEWNTDSINVTEEIRLSSYPASERRPLKYTMNISGGLVRDFMGETVTKGNATYNYDASNRLQHTNDWSINIYNEWENDKLISTTQKFETGEFITTFTYGESRPIKGYLPLVPNDITVNNPLFVAHPELGGMKTCQTFESKTIKFADKPDMAGNTSLFEYELDKDGYISKITSANQPNGNDSTATVYTLIWE
jgi:hypothetical protein